LIQHFALGINTWFRSWGFISRNGLMHYFLYPLLIGILWYMGMAVFIIECIDYLWTSFGPDITYDPIPNAGWIEQARAVLSEIGKYALAFVIGILIFYSSLKISKYIILIAMSPVMSMLSEKTNDILEGKSNPFSMQQLIRDVLRGTVLAIRNMFIELILIWAIGLINIFITIAVPPLGLILIPFIPLISFIVGAYFFGFSTMDYTNERHRLSIAQSIQLIRKNKGIAIANGSIFALLFRIPVIGVSICTVTCTVSACIAMKESRERV